MAFFFVVPLAFADAIRINEVVSNPETNKEWVEFFSEEDIDLSGASLFDEKGKIFVFPEDTFLASGEFFVAEGWSNKLNNTGDSVFLRDMNDNEVTRVENFPKMNKGESWAWNGVDFQKTTTITKGEKNSFSEEKSTSENINENTLGKEFFPPQKEEIEITEVMSNPETGDEWIEIFSSASETRSLEGVTISDEVGILYTFSADFSISPGEFLIISGWKNKLNNSGDSVFLKDASGNILDFEKDFPALDKNISWAKKSDNFFEKTNTPTPAAENIFTIFGTNSSFTGEKTPLVKTKASIPSVSADDIEIFFSEIVFRGKEEDFVELYCQKCNVDLGGIRLADDDVFFEFPQKTFIHTGEYIVIHLSKNPQKDVYKNGVWHFWSKKTGLTGTDETLFLLDSRGEIEHAVCIANQNGTFSPGERKDIVQLIHMRALRAYHPLSEAACFDSRSLGTNISLVFAEKKTGYSDKDFFWSPVPTPGEKNPTPPKRAEKIKIEMSVYQNEKIAFAEIKNIGQKLLDTKNIRLFSGEEKEHEIQIQNKILLPRETMFVSLEGNISSLRVTDFWKTKITSSFSEDFTFSQEQTDIVFSEIFANPRGKDAGKEFVEFVCLAKICNVENFFFFLDGKRIFPEDKKMRWGERSTLFIPVKNTEFSVEIYDVSQKKKQILHIPNAKEEKSWSRFGILRYEWGKPTPEKENIFDAQNANTDSDSDGVPDSIEREIQSNPFSANISSTEKKLFKNIVRHKTKITFTETKKDLHISGSSFPNAKIFFVLHSKKTILKTATDAEGKFFLSGNPNLPSGDHTLDVLLFPTKKNPIFLKDFSRFSVDENPQDKLLQAVEIILALPNPNGNDAKKEMIILQNTGIFDGFLSGAKIRSEKKEVLLPEIFLKAGQKKVLQANMLPSLLNTKSAITLLDSQGKILSSVSRKKARSGEWFGKNAPAFSPKEKKKTKTKKAPKYRAPIPFPRPADPPKSFEGEFRFLARDYVGVRLPNGEMQAYKLGEDFSKEAVNLLLSPGENVQIRIRDNKIFEITLPHHVLVDAISSSRFPLKRILFLLLFIGIGMSFTLLYVQKYYEVLFTRK